MKRSIGRIFIIITLILTVVAVQNAVAETISGQIAAISTRPNTITIDDTELNGIKFNYLENKYNIVLEIGDEVSVEAYEQTCQDGSIVLMAYAITVGDATITLR